MMISHTIINQVAEVLTTGSNTGFRNTLIALLTGNTIAILTVLWKITKNANKARKLLQRQNWRINILWQERNEGKGFKEDPIERELFGEHAEF